MDGNTNGFIEDSLPHFIKEGKIKNVRLVRFTSLGAKFSF